MIDLMPNATLFYQWGLFLIAVAVLNFFVFRPTLRIIAARQSATDGDEARAAEFESKSEELSGRIEENLERARRDGLQTLGRLRQQAEEEGQAIIATARQQMDEHLLKVRTTLDKQSKEVELQLRQHSRDLAGQVATRILGRKVG